MGLRKEAFMLITLSTWPTRRRSNKTGSRTAPQPYLNDSQWSLIADLFPKQVMSSAGGRRRIPARECLEGILWVLRSGARWKDLPDRYPSSTTCWRRHKQWTESGVFREAWRRLLHRLDRRRRIAWKECFADATFASAKKGVKRSVPPAEAREPRL